MGTFLLSAGRAGLRITLILFSLCWMPYQRQKDVHFFK